MINTAPVIAPIMKQVKVGKKDYVFSIVTTPVIIERGFNTVPVSIRDMAPIIETFKGLYQADKNGIVLMDAIWSHELLSSMEHKDLHQLAEEMFRSAQDGGYISGFDVGEGGEVEHKRMLGHVLGVMFWKEGQEPHWDQNTYKAWHRRFSEAIAFQLVDHRNVIGAQCLDLVPVDKGLWSGEVESTRIQVMDMLQGIKVPPKELGARILVQSNGINKNTLDISLRNSENRVVATTLVENDERLCSLLDTANTVELAVRLEGISTVEYNYGQLLM